MHIHFLVTYTEYLLAVEGTVLRVALGDALGDGDSGDDRPEEITFSQTHTYFDIW